MLNHVRFCRPFLGQFYATEHCDCPIVGSGYRVQWIFQSWPTCIYVDWCFLGVHSGKYSGSWGSGSPVGGTLPDSLTPSLPPRPVWTAAVAPKTLATLKTPSSQDWMDWGWSPWKRVEAKVAVAVVRMRAEMRPRPKLGLGSQALRTWPWRRRNKVGAPPVQPYLPQKMAPAKLHLGATSRSAREASSTSNSQNSYVAGPTNSKLSQLLPL